MLCSNGDCFYPFHKLRSRCLMTSKTKIQDRIYASILVLDHTRWWTQNTISLDLIILVHLCDICRERVYGEIDKQLDRVEAENKKERA